MFRCSMESRRSSRLARWSHDGWPVLRPTADLEIPKNGASCRVVKLVRQ